MIAKAPVEQLQKQWVHKSYGYFQNCWYKPTQTKSNKQHHEYTSMLSLTLKYNEYSV